MIRVEVSRAVHAPIAVVFKTVADIREFSKALPHVVSYEFLSDLHGGVGTRFRETRLMDGKEATTELEVTEFVENDHVRIVADSHGAVWDTTFRVAADGDSTNLTMTMDAISYTLLAKVMNYLFQRMYRTAVEKDMDLVKSFCEDAK